jgi:hypothetical protein
VGDDNRRLGEAVGDGQNLLGPQVHVVTRAVTAAPVAGEAERDDRAVAAELGRDVVPPPEMGAAAVDKQKSALLRLTPRTGVNGAAVHLDRGVLVRCGQGVLEPERCLGAVIHLVLSTQLAPCATARGTPV